MEKAKAKAPKRAEPSPLSLADEIAFELILRAGPFSKRRPPDLKDKVITYPRILEDL